MPRYPNWGKSVLKEDIEWIYEIDDGLVVCYSDGHYDYDKDGHVEPIQTVIKNNNDLIVTLPNGDIGVITIN